MCSPTPPTNATLIEAARDGDRVAWEALLERHDRVIGSVCRAHRLSDADAADVKQTTWLRAVEHLERLQDPDRIHAWLATVARHECLRLLRHAARVRPYDEEVVQRHPDAAAVPDARLLASERHAAVRGAVRSLGQKDRVLLSMLYSEPAPSYADIGRTLRMPVGSIGPTRGRVLERIRRHQPLAALAAAA
jgi:RNA polymerase sigma factor (sigma-70 family)